MAKYHIEGNTLTAIADAIREKGGTTANLTPAEMVTAIQDISGGMEIATGTFTMAEDTMVESTGYVITHNLGVVPNFFMLRTICDSTVSTPYYVRSAILHIPEGSRITFDMVAIANLSLANTANKYVYGEGSHAVAPNGNKLPTATSKATETFFANATETSVNFYSNAQTAYFQAGKEYEWIVGVI